MSSMIPIYIPSRGRFREDDIRRGPLLLLPLNYLRLTTLVVPIQEVGSYRRTIDRIFHPNTLGPSIHAIDYDGIAEKRERIGTIAASRSEYSFMMLDDDINFLRRVSPESASQHTITDPMEIGDMLATVQTLLLTYPQVAIGMREVNKTAMLGPPPLLEECSRAIRAVAWRTKKFNGLKHRRIRCMEDHDLTLQLLTSGEKNAVLWYWMSGQRGTNTYGGCSSWRTLEVHNEAAVTLHRLHPNVTRLRTKINKSGGAIAERLELTIQWKKAHLLGAMAQKSREMEGANNMGSQRQ